MRRTILLVLVLLMVAPAQAVEKLVAPGQAINISADSLVITESEKRAVFSGNVAISRTGLAVTANTVTVTYGTGIDDIKGFDATGNVSIQTSGQTATGQHAKFDPATQILQLTGGVTVQNGAGTMTGAELVVDLSTNNTVFKAGQGQRVTGVFTPQ